ncbi:MAG: hypothetical protein PHD56_14245 [Anaerostipes sp.]|nr:hypothetical protein [Eubacteriales bacterium]MDD4372202.1 hypothetical protein [Anaerostipes sp.]
MAITCFRYFGFTDFDQVDKMTLAQFEIMAEAMKLREIDKDYRNHLQAFLNFRVRSKKRSGKNKERPFYSTFKKFYDYDSEIRRATGKTEDKFSKVKEVMKRREK